VGIHLPGLYHLATAVCAKTFITDRVTVPAPSVLAAYVFGTGIFH
jgi:hypothetical protein